MEQAIGQSNTFRGPAKRLCPREQGIGVNGDAMRHLLKIRDNLEIQAPSMRRRLLLEPFDEGLGDILDGQGCHMGLLSGGSIVIPLWILARSSRNGQAGP
jgi:hypothetical protein